MDPAVFRAYSVASSTRPEDVREVENQLAAEEQIYREKGGKSEDFLEEINRKFPLNEVSVVQLLEVAFQLSNTPISIRRCEQFLLVHSRRSFEEKMNLAFKYNLDRLKRELTKPVQEETQEEKAMRHLKQTVLPHYPFPEDDPETDRLLNLYSELKRERDKEVYVTTTDNHRIYIGRVGDEEYEKNYERYLEFVRNTNNVPRYFTPIVLQSNEPNFVSPGEPVRRDAPEPRENNSPAYDYVIDNISSDPSEYILDHDTWKKPEVEAECTVASSNFPFPIQQAIYNHGNSQIFNIPRKELTKYSRVFFQVKLMNVMGFRVSSTAKRNRIKGKLNIGGKIFQTTDETLMKSYSFFQFYFLMSNVLPYPEEIDGAICIDRPPKHFELILNYMRDGDILLPHSEVEIREIMREAEQYWMKDLYELCKKQLDNKTTTNNSINEIVKLDIGGTVFKTTKATLTRFDGMFKTMLENDILVKTQDSDVIFIDRSAKHFDLILNYMRDGDVDLPENCRELQEIIREAQYYLLPGLLDAYKNFLSENSYFFLKQ
uniref:BTB domain-containing protein n=1 Tax=Caenorhabditis tropicalis TaxID=1561998 RepID=A0A1I7TCK9_9PELO